jgi:hypothetical protein
MADVPILGFWKYWTQKLASLKYECHVIMNKYPEAASVVQQVYKVLSDPENIARCTPAKVGEERRGEQSKLLQSFRWEAYF